MKKVIVAIAFVALVVAPATATLKHVADTMPPSSGPAAIQQVADTMPPSGNAVVAETMPPSGEPAAIAPKFNA